jgi:hypothetical protein
MQTKKSIVAQAVESGIEDGQFTEVDGPVEENQNEDAYLDNLDFIAREAEADEKVEADENQDEQEDVKVNTKNAQAIAGGTLAAIQGTVSLFLGVEVQYSDGQYEQFSKSMAPLIEKYGDKVPTWLVQYQAEISAAKAIALITMATIGQVKAAKQAKQAKKPEQSEQPEEKEAA